MHRRSALGLFVIALAAPRVAFAARDRESGDAQHAECTLAIGTIALDTSKLAESMSNNDWVKRFAKYEIAEQTTIAEILKSMGFTSEKSKEPEEMVDKLKKSANFDADYLAAQLDGHRQLLKIQDEYINSSDAKRAGLDVARMARTQIQEHIDLIQTIQNMKA
jgi:putative membrane protein